MPIDPNGIKWDDEPSQPQQSPAQTINPATIQWDTPVSDPLHQAQKMAESGGNQAAVSPKGAVGVMQVMPSTGPEAAQLAGLPWDPDKFKNDASYNEALGTAYQNKQKQTFGDDRLALAAYNAGPGTVSGLIREFGDPSKGEISWDQFAQHLPQETQNYVSKIVNSSNVPDLGETGRTIASGVKQGVGTLANAASGLYRGVEETARAPYEDVANMFGTTLDEALAPVSKYLPDHTPGQYLQEFSNWLTSVRPNEQPQTTAGKAASGVLGSALGGALIPIPGMSAATGAIQGGLAGAGSEVAAQALGDTPQNRLIGGIAVPTVAAGLTQVLPGVVKANLAKEALQGTSPYSLGAAKDAQAVAQDQGVNLTLGQSLPTSNNTLAVEQTLSQTSGGQGLLNQIRQQPTEIANAAQNFQAGLPGQVTSSRLANNAVQEAATDTINQAAKYRQSVVGPMIEGAGSIPTDMAKGIIKNLNSIAASSPNTTKSQLVQSLADKLQITKPLLDVNGNQIGTKQIPMTDINQINEVLKSESNAGKNLFNAGSSDKAALGLQTALITKIKSQLGDVNPQFAQGNAANAYIHETLDNPLKQGPIGAIAGQQGYLDTKSAPERIFSIFDKGTPVDPKTGQPGPSDILQTQRMLASNGPDGNQAFTNAGASWLASRFNKAIAQDGGGPVQNVASNIQNQFFGTDAKVQGFKDVLAGMAQSSGQDPQTIVNGGVNFMKTIQRAATIKGIGPGVTDAQLQKAQETPVGFLGRFTAVQPFRQPALVLQRFLGGNAEEEISNMLRSPEGIDQLKQLATVAPGSSASYKILSTGAGLANQVLPPSTQPQNGGN